MRMIAFGPVRSSMGGVGVGATYFLVLPIDSQWTFGIGACGVAWIDWSSSNGANLPSFSRNSSGAMPRNMNWSDQFGLDGGVADNF